MARAPTANIPFRRPAPDHWSMADVGVHNTCMAWAIHHANCERCGEEDWQRPGWPRAIDEEDVFGRRHIKATRPNGDVVCYVDEEDPGILCKVGKRLYNGWCQEVMRRVLKTPFEQ